VKSGDLASVEERNPLLLSSVNY